MTISQRKKIKRTSAPMLQIVAIPVQDKVSTPGPLYSII